MSFRLIPLARRATGWSIRARVALLAAGLGLAALGGLGWLHVTRAADAFSRASESQGLTLGKQLADAVPLGGDVVLEMIPFSRDGLDGAVLFDARGRVQGSSGRLAPVLRALSEDARAVARTGRPIQHFREPADARRRAQLSPLSESSTFQVTVVPTSDGAVATGVHAGWAADQLRALTVASVLGLAGGSLVLAFGLLLAAGGLVTRPVERLAAEVRRLGEGNLDTRLSAQRTPELEQLAGDIAHMRDDLLAAVRESATDPLTGIANHRAFHERLDAAVAHARHAGAPLALIAIDVDDLKSVNDRHGHQAGDQLIGTIAGAILAAVRDGDLCARIGGDEFAVICPDAGRAEALAVAARIEAAVADIADVPLVDGRGRPIALTASASVGVGELAPGGAGGKDQLVHSADAAMYAAKASRKGGAVPAARPLVPATGTAPDPDPDATVRALALALEARDAATRGHSETVAQLAAGIAERLGLAPADVEAVRRAALLHDVGMLGVPDAILRKPDGLTADELAIVRRHSDLGYRMLRAGGLALEEATWVLHHHEHVDGSGYPHGLRDAEIPLASRIVLVADAFEAMTSDRPYRPSRSPADALAELRRCAGSQFDPSVVEELAILLARDDAAAPRRMVGA